LENLQCRSSFFSYNAAASAAIGFPNWFDALTFKRTATCGENKLPSCCAGNEIARIIARINSCATAIKMSWAVYAGIFLLAAIEGEVGYVSALVLVYLGRLNAVAVLVAGAMGGSAGDQFYFYILRTGLVRWLDRFPAVVKRRDKIRDKVGRNANLMILISRFLPGLRIAIPAACSYAGVKPLRFTCLSLLSGFAWAGTLMGIIMYLGPSSLQQLGLRVWWVPAIPAIAVILFFRWLARTEARD
jgi:membrane protein DedA with SNARE-associated domain